MKSRFRYAVAAASVILMLAGGYGLAAPNPGAPFADGPTQRISDSTGAVQGNLMTTGVAVSATGRYVAFASASTDLLPRRGCQHDSGVTHVYLRDRTTNRITLVDATRHGCPTFSGAEWPAISADGRYVAFATDSPDLPAANQPRLPAHGPWSFNVYVRDIRTGVIQLVSIGRQHTLANSAIDNFGMSADGRYFAFQTTATNLVAGDTAGRRLSNGQVLPDVYLRDRVAATTIRIGRASRPDGYGKYHPSISPDGRYVAFYSNDPSLVPPPTTYSECGDTAIPGACDFIHQLDPPYQVYRFDRMTKRTVIASVSPAGVAGNFDSELPDQGTALSAGGRYLVFWSNATNLALGDDAQQTGATTDSTPDVYVRDMTTDTTTRVSVGPAGLPGDNLSNDATISANGQWIAFDSIADNLVPGDTNGIAPAVADASSEELGEDIFIANRLTGNIMRISVDSDGQQANGDSYRPVISGDGSCVAFVSRATNLVANDTNLWPDGFVHCYQPPASLLPTAARS